MPRSAVARPRSTARFAALAVVVTAGTVAAVPAATAAADPAGASIVEDYAYPGSADVEQQRGIRLVRGDGRVTLADCDGADDLIIVESVGRGNFCFRVKGDRGFLALELAQVYLIRGGDEPVTARVTASGTTTDVPVAPGTWEPIGANDPNLGVLLELRAGQAAAPAVGSPAAPAGPHPYVAKIDIGVPGAPDARSCTGALVRPEWVVTARSCFGTAGEVRLGGPRQAVVATVGRADLTTSAGQVAPIVRLVPHAERDVVLARLASPVNVTPVSLAAAAPVAGDVLRGAGYGRTATEWVPDGLHVAAYEVTGVEAGTVDVIGQGPEAVGPCKGDAGGPLLRETATGVELVGINVASRQAGCLGVTGATPGATGTRLDDLRDWVRQQVADVGVFGVTGDGRLTYSAIESPSGDRVSTVTSTASLGFTPRALVALNFNTLLVTSTANRLHRVDIASTDPLVFAPPVDIGGGWSHQLLAYDGHGSLFGIAGTLLRRYTVTSAKPVGANIINYTSIDEGFSLNTLAAAGPDWIIGTTTSGLLLSYRINGAGSWNRYQLATGWHMTSLLSPGGGLYYARTAAAAGLYRYRDAAPFDGSGADIQTFTADPVDPSGWNQAALSAVPFTSFPQAETDVAVFGVTGDGRLTLSAIDSASGDRVSTVTSAASLGFTPRALAVLNFNTLLVTSTAGRLHRVDVVATNPLVFAAPVDIGGGWSHQLLAYDGYGSLFGIAGSTLRRYTVTSAKPGAAQITNNTVIDEGFGLNTLTATGPGWILGTTSAGPLLAYRIIGAHDWDRYQLATGWRMTALLSPGAGLYYARTASTGGLYRYRDAAPFDGSGADIQTFTADPVDASGWNQVALGAVPFAA